MWYKLTSDGNSILNAAPANKKMPDGSTIINYNLDVDQLKLDGYVEYTGTKPISALKVVDGEIVEKTNEEIADEEARREAGRWSSYFHQNPDLAVCVREYKGLLDNYSLPYTAKTGDISNAILTDTAKTDIEKIILGFGVQATWNNIILNLESVHISQATSFAWENMPLLIQYLPEIEEPETPEEPEVTEVTE